eukprot:CAMPEP_0168333406 /NCGR_PEP_ID=MMETSP0213-20121227/9594_1 /TAXON_ID=151035 /ORGANISM="Euplotes harpa, Strain FSP1.4" /LENGTH=127 /DNA_ID=CAMNT_0008337735 /DNA_START=1156 /DNA_END=1539 /DNA_ORIENTATION=-
MLFVKKALLLSILSDHVDPEVREKVCEEDVHVLHHPSDSVVVAVASGAVASLFFGPDVDQLSYGVERKGHRPRDSEGERHVQELYVAVREVVVQVQEEQLAFQPRVESAEESVEQLVSQRYRKSTFE